MDQSASANVYFTELAKLHQNFIDENHCFVVEMSEDFELFLVPVLSNKVVFWGYFVLKGVVTLMTEMLETCKIPLILDLDNTLILTQTLSSLANHKLRLSAKIQTLKDTSGSDKELELLVKEQDCVLDDIRQLELFCEQDQIVINDDTHTSIKAQHEFVDLENVFVLRPVIRSGNQIFTRIDPLKNQTSMIIRIREGWDDLRRYLTSQGTINNHQRFKVWVCTAAERRYALEAWRLLDPGSELIPKTEINTRIICSGNQQKSLLSTFHLGSIHEVPMISKTSNSMSKLSSLNEGCSEMSMAIIVDDRMEVWVKRNQNQILKITPFNYKDINKNDDEMLKLTSNLKQIRSNFYFEIFKRLEPKMKEVIKQGFEDEKQIQDFQEMFKNGSSITPFLTLNCPRFEPPMKPPLNPNSTQQHTNKTHQFQGQKWSEIISQISKQRTRNLSLKRPIDLICETEEESEDEIYVPPIPTSKTKQSKDSFTPPQSQDYTKSVRKCERRKSEKSSESMQCRVVPWKKELLMSPTLNKITMSKLANGGFPEQQSEIPSSQDLQLEDGEVQD